MGVIADECPRCRQVTRCVVTERQGFFGGLIGGIPFFVPLSSVRCVCGECGHEFQSRSAAENRAVPFEVAAGLDTDALLRLTNPEVRQAHSLSRLRADPQLRDAFLLLDRLAPGSLRVGLRDALIRWPVLGEPDRADLLERVEACTGAERFARAMAGRYSIGAAGCLAGVLGAIAVWVPAGLTFEGLGTSGWLLVIAIGLAAGGAPCYLLWQVRDRQWVRNVLLPEANKAGVEPRWLLAVVEGTAGGTGAADEVGALRGVGPALRAALAAESRGRESALAGFKLPPRGHRPAR
jgi:hypothetical protein